MDKMADSRLQQINEIFMSDDEGKVSAELSPAFYAYYRSFFKEENKFKRYFLAAKNIFEITEAGGKRVLDAGCGYGTITLSLALLGVREVIGIDENQDAITVCNKLIAGLVPPLENIRAEIGDILHIPHEDAYFDIVIVTSALSHVRDLPASLSEIKRVLRKGGRLYVAMDNNSLYVGGRLFRRKFW